MEITIQRKIKKTLNENGDTRPLAPPSNDEDTVSKKKNQKTPESSSPGN